MGLAGDWTVGRRTRRAGRRAAAASSIASMPATCIWCWAPPTDGKPVRFRVMIDGAAPGADHGVDIDAEGNGA